MQTQDDPLSCHPIAPPPPEPILILMIGLGLITAPQGKVPDAI